MSGEVGGPEELGARGKVQGRRLDGINENPKHCGTRIGGREIERARGRWASVQRKTQGRGRGRGGALATSEVDGGPGARPVLR